MRTIFILLVSIFSTESFAFPNTKAEELATLSTQVYYNLSGIQSEVTRDSQFDCIMPGSDVFYRKSLRTLLETRFGVTDKKAKASIATLIQQFAFKNPYRADYSCHTTGELAEYIESLELNL